MRKIGIFVLNIFVSSDLEFICRISYKTGYYGGYLKWELIKQTYDRYEMTRLCEQEQTTPRTSQSLFFVQLEN